MIEIFILVPLKVFCDINTILHETEDAAWMGNIADSYSNARGCNGWQRVGIFILSCFVLDLSTYK